MKPAEDTRRHAKALPMGQLAFASAAAIAIKSRGRFMPVLALRHPVTGKAVLYVTEAHMAALHRRFLILRLIRKKFGLQHHPCVTRTKTTGGAFAPDAGFWPDHGRKNVEQVLIAARS